MSTQPFRMSTATPQQIFDEIVRDILSGSPSGETVEIMERLQCITRKMVNDKVRFLQKSLVGQAIIMKKIECTIYNLLVAGVSKVRGTKRFAPRKESSTLKKNAKMLRQTKIKFIGTGRRDCDWREFVNRICNRHGHKCMYKY